MDVREFFPELKIEKCLYDDYYELVFRFENKKSGEMIVKLPRLNPRPEEKEYTSSLVLANALTNEDREWLLSRWPYLVEPIVPVGYDWWTDLRVTFNGGERGYPEDIWGFIKKLKLLIAVLEEVERDRDDLDYGHWPDALKPDGIT
jgi:hypothetical protein